MDKKVVTYLIPLLCIFMFSSLSTAALHDRGGGLIFDDDLNITWLQNANFGAGTMTWYTATTWAENLIYQGYEDWRLPSSDNCAGTSCTESEMGHLYFIEGISSDSPGLFTDVRPYMYWSRTEASANPSEAFRFHYNSGSQGVSSKGYSRYAWAVRDGDSAPPVVPEPVSSVLFLAGGVTMAMRRWKKNGRGECHR